jgi:hypothetical protein
LLSQKDSVFLEDFYGSQVIYTDIGFNTAPFSLHYDFPNGINKLNYKNNFKPFLGIGFAYKWFSVRAGLPILGYFRSKDLYGETKQYNLGFDFDIKKIHFDIEFRYIEGYSIKNAKRWDKELTKENPNAIVSNLGSLNTALNAWYFNNKEFKIKGLHGKRAHYNKPVQTWYVKGTINLFGADNVGSSIIPFAMQDQNNSKTTATRYSAFDFGLIPGYAYVNRIKNWQFCGWFGLGGVFQSKFYRLEHESRGFLGLAPRYDVRIMGGYSNKKYFAFLIADFDNKSIRYSDLVYRQFYYSVKITGGIRLDHKKFDIQTKVKKLPLLKLP